MVGSRRKPVGGLCLPARPVDSSNHTPKHCGGGEGGGWGKVVQKDV